MLDALIYELPQLQVDGEPGLAIAEQKGKDFHRRPLEGLQHRLVLELRVVEPPQVAVRVVPELVGELFTGLDDPAVRRGVGHAGCVVGRLLQ